MAGDDLFDGFLDGLGFDPEVLDFLRGTGSLPNSKEVLAKETRIKDLITVFSTRNAPDITSLTRAVSKHADEVTGLNREDLTRAHAHAAVYVGNLEVAMASFSRIDISDRERAVVGLIAYDAGDHDRAKDYLQRVTSKIAQVRMALSSIKTQAGETDLASHSRLLAPVASSPSASSYLNTFLGVHAFNHGDYSTAESHFNLALNKISSPEAQLRVMQAKFKQGKKDEVWSMAGRYLHDADLSGSDDLTTRLKLEELDFPIYTVNRKTLYAILS